VDQLLNDQRRIAKHLDDFFTTPAPYDTCVSLGVTRQLVPHPHAESRLAGEPLAEVI
jgi:hypothetical protein